MNYEQAGVSIQKADLLTDIIRDTVVSENIGMFAGLFEHPYFPEYYLVACTDGVGTKVIPLKERGYIDTIATDLIAMNLNDMICTGARPLFFLDYFATHTLDVEITSKFVKSLKDQLAQFNCVLLGGETAELKDVLNEGHFDVGGFAVGAIQKDKLLTKSNVKENDIVIGLESSGPHSNGYTLIRKLFDVGKLSLDEFESALKPTHLYVNEVIELTQQSRIKVAANITGGGIADNLKRVIPNNLTACISKDNIPYSQLFRKLKEAVGDEEAYKTFNMGVGMCLIVSPDNISSVVNICNKFNPFIFGEIKQLNSEELVHLS